MKYIRTKDGSIFEDEYVHIKVDKDGYAIMEYKGDFYEAPEKVKQADTIEELCDGLIVEDKDNTNNWFVMDISEYQSKDNVDKKYMVDRWNFYAFIKVDKGLIYVAQMNESGCLELL